MAIVTMKKFTLLAFHRDKAHLLKELQKFGDVHFRDLVKADLEEMDFLKEDFSPEQALHCEGELDKVNFAMSRVAPFAPKGKMTDKRPTLSFEDFDTYVSGYDYAGVCDRVKAEDDKVSSIRSEISRLRSENDGLRSWIQLDISPRKLDSLEQARALIGTINRAAAESFAAAVAERFPSLYLEELGAVKDDNAMLLIVPAENYDDLFTLCKDLGFSRASLNFDGVPREIIEENNARIRTLEQEREAAQENIRDMGGAYSQLMIVRDYYHTLLAREKARGNFLSLDSVVVIEGWVPEEDALSLQDLLGEVCGGQYYLEYQDVPRDSADVPIKLKNNRFVTAFTDITAMFSAPRYNEIDPTPVLTPFYWLFFGLMVGDMGYGLILLVATLLAPKLIDMSAGMKNFMRFFFYLSFAVILGGAIYGSCFGVTVFAPIPYVDEFGVAGTKPILDAQNGGDIPIMLVASIGLGVIHIIVGLLTKAYMSLRDGDVAGAIFDSLFWITTVLSAIGCVIGSGMIGGTSLAPTLYTACKVTFVLSLVGLALTQGRESPSLGGKIGNGLYGVYGISGYVGDLVSYTRIVALALSGAYIAFSFNLMAGLLPEGFIRIVCGGIIVVLGQTLNLGLALLGAYVHTCRLQYVEFFGKFYEGGGIPFSPLKLENNYVHIEQEVH